MLDKKRQKLHYLVRFIKYNVKKIIPSKILIKILWKKRLRYELDLKNPKTFNEKIQWLKLYYRNDLMKICANKLTVRDYVSEKIGFKYLNEIIAVYNKIDELDLSKLPEKFVIKCSHDSGSAIIVKDKRNIDIDQLKIHFKYCMKIDYYHMSKEWAYKGGIRKILVEKFLCNSDGSDIKDYKVFCFWGEPKLIQVDIDRHTNHRRNIYDVNWNWIDLSILYPKDPTKIEPPPLVLDEMLNLSRILSEPFPHVRVDWYIVDNELKFGEMTFYHGGGFEPFDKREWEYVMGEWIDLKKLKNNKK